MNILLLSGGSGKRLWPLSNGIRSKQFIKIFKRSDGSYESMLQRVYRQLRSLDFEVDITIATNRAQVSAIRNQIGDKADLAIEPCSRDTFPAIALAGAYLVDVKGISEEEFAVVCPVDPYVERDYFEALKMLAEQAEKGEARLVLMGIEPAYPSEKYGYMIPEKKDRISKVLAFKEKPDLETAKQYMEQGALWNSGVFVFRLSYLIEQVRKKLGYCDYQTLLENYAKLPKISFDCAIAEKEDSIQVMRFGGTWKDLGTWNTLTEAMDEVVIGDGRMDDTCENVYILNELDMPVLAMGLRDVIISASVEGILVSDREQSSYMKPFVEYMHRQIRFAEKSWGSFKVIDVEEESLTIKVTLNPGHSMNYHSHEFRDEVWTVISGRGYTVINGKRKPVKTGDVTFLRAGDRHTIIADTGVELIEVQLGREISVRDKKKHELEGV